MFCTVLPPPPSPKSLCPGHSCGGNFFFDGRSLGLLPLLRSRNVLLTHANCTQLKPSSGHGSWPGCWLVIGNHGILRRLRPRRSHWVLFFPCDKCSSWRVGRPHWPHFLLGRKQWKYGRILLRLLQCTIGGSRSLLRSKMLKFCTNSAIVDNVGGNAKFWWLSQSCYVIRGMAWGEGGVLRNATRI